MLSNDGIAGVHDDIAVDDSDRKEIERPGRGAAGYLTLGIVERRMARAVKLILGLNPWHGAA